LGKRVSFAFLYTYIICMLIIYVKENNVISPARFSAPAPAPLRGGNETAGFLIGSDGRRGRIRNKLFFHGMPLFDEFLPLAFFFRHADYIVGRSRLLAHCSEL